jgi:hypothetical protein
VVEYEKFPHHKHCYIEVERIFSGKKKKKKLEIGRVVITGLHSQFEYRPIFRPNPELLS